MNGIDHRGPGDVPYELDTALPDTLDSSNEDGLVLQRLRASIRNTEDEMVETLNAIQEKLSIENILKQTGEMARDAFVRRIEVMASKLSETGPANGNETLEKVKEHPGMTALVGMGLGFLLMSTLLSRSRGEKRGNQETYTEIQGGDGEHVMHPEGGKRGSVFIEEGQKRGVSGGLRPETVGAAGSNREDSPRVLGNIGERAARVRSRARHAALSTRDRASRLVDDKPLVVGVVALSAGVALGMMCRGAFAERHFADEARKNIRRRTRDFVEGARDRAERFVQEVSNAARKEAERQHIILPEQHSENL